MIFKVYETTLNSGSGRGKKSSKYSEFENTAKQLLASTSARRSQPGTIQDGDVIFENFVSDVDPITKKVMVHPVKNKKCGHYYEKSSILEVISINRQLRLETALLFWNFTYIFIYSIIPGVLLLVVLIKIL